MSVLGHVPEKDGILADLLVLEMMASRQKTLAELRDDLFSRVGALYSRRIDHRLDAAGLEDRLTAVGSMAEEMARTMDFRFLFDSSRKLFSIGYLVADDRLDPSFYDLLASESRPFAAHQFRSGSSLGLTCPTRS